LEDRFRIEPAPDAPSPQEDGRMDCQLVVGVPGSSGHGTVRTTHGHLEDLSGKPEGRCGVGRCAGPRQECGKKDDLPGMGDPDPCRGFCHQEIADVLSTSLQPGLGSGPNIGEGKALGKGQSVDVPMERLPCAEQFQNSPGWEQFAHHHAVVGREAARKPPAK